MLNNLLIMGLFDILFNRKIEIDHSYMNNQISLYIENFENEYEDYKDYLEKNTWNGERKEVIIKKINRYLNSTLKNKGEFIVNYSILKKVDPYLVTAIILQETGCYYNCSYLVKHCNNVGGNKGTPSCNNGSYRKFNSIEQGLKFSINKISSYYNRGLTTPKKINPYYATDKTWYKKVNNYMKKLKR